MASRPVRAIHNAPPDKSSDDVCQERFIHAEHVLAVRHNLLSTDKATRISSLFSVLSDPTRLQVVYALLCAPTGEFCVCDLAARLGPDDSTITNRLRVLRLVQIESWL